MSHTVETAGVAGLGPEIDLSTATKADVEHMITDRLLAFHQALIDRSQIKSIPLDKAEWENPPKAVEVVA